MSVRGLSLKTKWGMVCRLHYKIDGWIKMARDTCRYLSASFALTQVGLEFPSLASILADAQHGWCMWHHHRGRVKMKPKTDVSM
jgi:hypothetical protein